MINTLFLVHEEENVGILLFLAMVTEKDPVSTVCCSDTCQISLLSFLQNNLAMRRQT